MLMLLGLALPLAVFGLGFSGDSDDDNSVSLEGTDDADTLEGEQGSDFIDGLAGDDILSGLAGADTILGREGDDVLEGADGNDMLCSGEGDDVVTGNVGQDFIEGQEGDDFVSGDYGWDTVNGDEGNDTVVGGRGADVVRGGDGDDVMLGGIIEGVPLNLEELTALRDGESLSDLNGGIDLRDDSMGNTLWGGDGDDDIVIGSGDLAGGGAGLDTFHIMSEQVGGAEATITNYNSTDDAITVIVDDIEDDVEISVTDEDGDAVVSMGDTVLVRVSGAAGQVSASDISLIAEETVAQMFNLNGATT